MKIDQFKFILFIYSIMHVDFFLNQNMKKFYVKSFFLRGGFFFFFSSNSMDSNNIKPKQLSRTNDVISKNKRMNKTINDKLTMLIIINNS